MKKKYELTPEHLAQMEPWTQRWIANAMSTKMMDDEDRRAMHTAINGMYAAIKLPPPTIVFVPSPFVLRFTSGFAAGIWHLGKKKTTRRSITATSTVAAATKEATKETGEDAPQVIAPAPVNTAETSLDSWYIYDTSSVMAFLRDYEPETRSFLLECCKWAWRMWQGGNQWSANVAFLSFFRHVAKLPIDYSVWDHWEKAAIHGGPRVMHEKFCIVSDRPERLLVDGRNRPHSSDGPFCRWRDGSALYAVHGVRLPAWIIERPKDITVAKIDAEANVEVRRVMIERYGQAQFIRDSNAKLLDHDEACGSLWRREVTNDEPVVILEMLNRTPEPDGSFKHYFERVPPGMTSAHEAHNWRRGFRPDVQLKAWET